jgi:ribosome-binding factor A
VTDSPRSRKLADQIQRILAERLQKGLRDPDLGYVTITDVRVTGDLQHATVFFTVLGTDEERELSAKALQRATGMLRTEVGKHLRIRLTPTLEFVPDALPETAGEIERLLGEAKQRDEAVRQAASGAHYAGEENPYKADDEDH